MLLHMAVCPLLIRRKVAGLTCPGALSRCTRFVHWRKCETVCICAGNGEVLFAQVRHKEWVSPPRTCTSQLWGLEALQLPHLMHALHAEVFRRGVKGQDFVGQISPAFPSARTTSGQPGWMSVLGAEFGSELHVTSDGGGQIWGLGRRNAAVKWWIAASSLFLLTSATCEDSTHACCTCLFKYDTHPHLVLLVVCYTHSPSP